MKFADVIRRSGRNLRQAKARTFLTAMALGVGGFSLTLTLAASQGARDYAHRLVSTNFDPSSLIVAKDASIFTGGSVNGGPQPYDDSLVSIGGQNGSGFYVQTLSDTDISKLRTIPGVENVLVSYSSQAQYITGSNDAKYTGSFEAFSPYVNHVYNAGNVTDDATLVGKAVVPADYLFDLGYASPQSAIGQPLHITVRQLNGTSLTKDFTIAAVSAKPSTLADATSGDNILLADTDAKALYDYVNQGTTSANKHTTVSVRVKDGTDTSQIDTVKQAIEQAGYAAQSVQDTEQFLNQIINVLQIIILVFGAITLIASFFGVINTQYISVLERTREIGLMKALGMSRVTVSKLFVIEATWIGFLGAFLGAVTAFVVGTLLNPWLSQKLDFGSDRLLVFAPAQIGLLIIFLMIITTLAGLLPARKAAKLDPIDALRTE